MFWNNTMWKMKVKPSKILIFNAKTNKTKTTKHKKKKKNNKKWRKILKTTKLLMFSAWLCLSCNCNVTYWVTSWRRCRFKISSFMHQNSHSVRYTCFCPKNTFHFESYYFFIVWKNQKIGYVLNTSCKKPRNIWSSKWRYLRHFSG